MTGKSRYIEKVSTLSIRDLDLKNKRVFMRVDFNVPLAPGGKEITSDKRIKASLPSIQYALGARRWADPGEPLGRPKGKPNPEMSLAPCAERLSTLLGKPVAMAPDCVGPQVEAMLPKPGEVLLLENLRFHPRKKRTIRSFRVSWRRFATCTSTMLSVLRIGLTLRRSA